MIKNIIIESLPGFQPNAKIGKINVKLGDNISKGDTILTVEGKKGAKEVISEFSGAIESIDVEEGETIEKNALLATIKAVEEQEEDLDMENLEYSRTIEIDVAVLGGGPGGYVAAIRASQNGKKVVLIEEDRLGGTCLNRGCIPTKSMVQSLQIRDLVDSSEIFGIENTKANISMEKLMDRKNGVVDTLVSGLDMSMEKHNIEVLRGRGVGYDKNTLGVRLANENVLVNFDHLILAPGSIVSIPDFEGADADDILTSNELLELREIPKSLIILGGRVIAMEFAFIYSKLGSDVTVIQRSDSIFPNFDEDVREIVRNSAIEHGIKLIEGTSVKSIKSSVCGGKVLTIDHKGEEKIIAAEKLAIATGRKPNLEGLNLDKLGVELDEKGRAIVVDEEMRTNVDNIYAIGDATNIINLAHVASKQGIVAADNIMGKNIKMKYNAIPEAVFTDPEIGLVGVTETECKEKGIEYVVGKFPYMNNGKALVANDTEGFIKVISEKDSGKIIGAALIGLHATDLLAIFSNLVANANTIDQAKDVIYAHPTVSETAFEAILDLDGESIHK